MALAVITYRRPAELADLLRSVQAQEPPGDGAWSARIVVVDNDPDASAREIAQASVGPWPITYAVEADPGIPAARETSVSLCEADDAVVFVDDDESAPPGWLDRLVRTWMASGADVVTGPVRGVLPADAPRWARGSDMFDSTGRHRTGDHLSVAFTNNTLVARTALDAVTPRFDQAFRFTGSSDLHFFRQVSRAGCTIVWDDQAVVEEKVPSSRLTRSWFVRRAFRSGAGDSVSRRLLLPWWRAVPESLVMGVARIGNGLALLLTGVLCPSQRIKGIRRIVSGVGTLAGAAGVNHAEYRR